METETVERKEEREVLGGENELQMCGVSCISLSSKVWLNKKHQTILDLMRVNTRCVLICSETAAARLWFCSVLFRRCWPQTVSEPKKKITLSLYSPLFFSCLPLIGSIFTTFIEPRYCIHYSAHCYNSRGAAAAWNLPLFNIIIIINNNINNEICLVCFSHYFPPALLRWVKCAWLVCDSLNTFHHVITSLWHNSESVTAPCYFCIAET